MAGPLRSTIRRRAGLVGALLLVGAARAAEPLPESPPPSPPPLPEVLRGLERASRLYLDSALRFACRESIVERTETRNLSRRFEYLFVRDLTGALQDYRQIPGRKGRPPVRTEPVEVGFRRYLERAYMWVLVFRKDRQPRFNYRLDAMEELDGVPAIRVAFSPIPPMEKEINDWYGTAWVDPATYQILKVEAMNAERHAAWLQLQADMESLRAGDIEVTGESYRIERVTTEFKVVKNGMRFPSRVEIHSSLYYLPRGGSVRRAIKALEEKTEQTYTQYVFYGVRTSEEVSRILKGESVPRH